MAKKLHESLSALMDNEADALELRRILKEMEILGDSNSAEEMTELVELKAKWHRFHVVSASLKQEIHSAPSRNLLTAIQTELEQDAAPARSLVNAASDKGVFRMLGQGAIAASVALAVLFTADLVMVADSTTGNESAAQLAGGDTTTNQISLTGELNPATTTRVAVQNSLDPEEMSRLERVVSTELEEVLETREQPAIFDPEE
jgi:negative regulator of sigma E activity